MKLPIVYALVIMIIPLLSAGKVDGQEKVVGAHIQLYKSSVHSYRDLLNTYLVGHFSLLPGSMMGTSFHFE